MLGWKASFVKLEKDFTAEELLDREGADPLQTLQSGRVYPSPYDKKKIILPQNPFHSL